MDVSARTTMKDAAKCDKRCEWQNSANQKKAERILRFQVPPESMLGSERLHHNVTKHNVMKIRCVLLTFSCVSDAHFRVYPLTHQIYQHLP